MRATIAKAPGFSIVAGKYNAETGVHRSAEFSYTGVVEDFAGLSKTILLEMGTRGGVNPFTVRRTRSMIGEYTAQNGLKDLASDLAAFDVEMLDARRTFVEKLFTIHAAFLDNHAANKTRHYYDVYRLCALEEIQQFPGTEEYRQILLSVKMYSKAHFPKMPLPDRDSLSDSPALCPKGEDLEKLRRNYVRERHLFFREPPTMDTILDAILPLLSKS